MSSSLQTRIQKALKYRKSIAADGEVVNQASLAAACRVREASVSNWFSGATKSLKATTAARAAAYLRVNPEYLAGTSSVMVLDSKAKPSPPVDGRPPQWPFRCLTPTVWRSLSPQARREIETYALGVAARRDEGPRAGGSFASAG